LGKKEWGGIILYKMFTRYFGNPILSSDKNHGWEGMAVFNPGVTLFQGKFYLLYRAIGEYKDYISNVGLAVSEDGFNFTRNPEPLLSPEEIQERYGIEDLRVNNLEGAFYLTHTALTRPATKGGEPHQVSLIKTRDFKNFQKMGVITPKYFCSRNAVLFPEKINGKYAMLHRPLYLTRTKHPQDFLLPRDPSVWISYSEDFFHWTGRKVVLEPMFWWEDFKIGGGTPPLKTERGWLIIYHGVQDVDYENKVYRAGLALLDLKDPSKVIYRSEEPILEPEKEYEIVGDSPNVVFPTGLVEKEGILYLYYGAADTTVCVATAEKEKLLNSLI